MKIDILAIGAHPDDVELGCGGTLAKLISEGKTVAILDLTEGELGTRGTVETRYNEAATASKILGVSDRKNLQLPDGFLENIREYQMPIIQMIRYYRPEIVFCNAVKDRHPDHAKASKMVSDACFLSGLIKIKTQYQGSEQTAWRPKQVFHYIQWQNLKPDFVVDVTGFEDQKMQACLAYKTQFYDPESKEPMTVIATESFTESIRYRMQDMGRLSGVDFAEGFTTEKTLILKNFDGIIL